MSDRQVALIRGINVGRAKRVAMADLRALLEELGYTDVRTLLNSGNALFCAPAATRPADTASRIESALGTKLGVPARVLVLSAQEIADVVAENPLRDIATDPSRLLVALFVDPVARSRLNSLEGLDHAPDVLAVGARAAYVWCDGGILASRLLERMGRLLGDTVTTRNWGTIVRLQALLDRSAP